MAYTVKFDQMRCCVMVAIQGEMDLPLFRQIVAEVARELTRSGCQRVEVDLRQASLVKAAFDVYEMPGIAGKVGVRLQDKRALIVGDRRAEFEFLETVFQNQGNNTRLFSNSQEAEAWLFQE